MTDPNVQAWRSAHTTLGSRLVDVESQPNVALARAGVLTGGDRRGVGRRRLGPGPRLGDLPGAGRGARRRRGRPRAGRRPAHHVADPRPTARRPTRDRPRRRQLRRRRRRRRGRAPRRRLGLARPPGRRRPQGAAACGDAATERSRHRARRAGWRPTRSRSPRPTSSGSSRPRPPAATAVRPQAAAASASTSTCPAPATCWPGSADTDGAADELAHAATRLVGVATTVPVPDLDALGNWLDRIATAAAAPHGDRARAAADLTAWFAAAQAPARRARRRARPRPVRHGAPRARAAACGPPCGPRRAPASSTRTPTVAAALAAAKDLLWPAPCDLDAAEAALDRLSARAHQAGPQEDR